MGFHVIWIIVRLFGIHFIIQYISYYIILSVYIKYKIYSSLLSTAGFDVLWWRNDVFFKKRYMNSKFRYVDNNSPVKPFLMDYMLFNSVHLVVSMEKSINTVCKGPLTSEEIGLLTCVRAIERLNVRHRRFIAVKPFYLENIRTVNFILYSSSVHKDTISVYHVEYLLGEYSLLLLYNCCFLVLDIILNCFLLIKHSDKTE